MKNAKTKVWRVNPGDIMIKQTGSRLTNLLNKLFHRSPSYLVGFAVCPETRLFNSKVKWYTPRRQYSKEEKMAFILAMVQLPNSLTIDEMVVILGNTVRPDTFTSANFSSVVDIIKNPYYRELNHGYIGQVS